MQLPIMELLVGCIELLVFGLVESSPIPQSSFMPGSVPVGSPHSLLLPGSAPEGTVQYVLMPGSVPDGSAQSIFQMGPVPEVTMLLPPWPDLAPATTGQSVLLLASDPVATTQSLLLPSSITAAKAQSALLSGSGPGATVRSLSPRTSDLVATTQSLLLPGSVPAATTQSPFSLDSIPAASAQYAMPGLVPAANVQSALLPGSVPAPTTQSPFSLDSIPATSAQYAMPGLVPARSAPLPPLSGSVSASTTQSTLPAVLTRAAPSPILPGFTPVASKQAPQIINYKSQQGLNGYSFSYDLTDGTARREEGRLEDGIWVVFWGAEWMDDSHTSVRITSDQNGVSWSISKGTAIVAPADIPPSQYGPPIPQASPDIDNTVNIDLKKEKPRPPPPPPPPFFIQGCKDMYDKHHRIKGISCLAKASLAGGTLALNLP